MADLVDLYPYRFNGKTPELFVGLRAPDTRYAGQWRMVGGKVKPGEKAWEAALRELREELGVTPERCWSPPTLNQFYDPRDDRIYQIPVFAAEIGGGEQITLNHEHSRYCWITIEQIADYISWPEQRRIMELIHELLIRKVQINDWEIPQTR